MQHKARLEHGPAQEPSALLTGLLLQSGLSYSKAEHDLFTKVHQTQAGQAGIS